MLNFGMLIAIKITLVFLSSLSKLLMSKYIFNKLKISSRMKQFFVLFALVGFFAFNGNAQTCNKSKASSSKAKTTAVQSMTAAADKAAMLDASVEKKVCSTSGTVSYMKNSTCAVSGKMTSAAVEYCSKSGKFVNVSPSAKKDCSKSCTKGKAKATKTSVKVTKTSAKGASCCASKKAASCSSAAKATMVSNKSN
ncbi:MAG: hypothetical protein ACI9XO_000412 [Paraglaciecola sp.]|jgi:hypothetical protein